MKFSFPKFSLGETGLVGDRGKLGQDRYFKYFPTNANQIYVVDAQRRCLLAHRDTARSRPNAVFTYISLLSGTKSDFLFLQIIYHNSMNNGSSPSSMHPGKLIVFCHRSRDCCMPDHKSSTCFQNGDGCSGLVGQWGRWFIWPNSPQCPSTLVQVTIRNSDQKVIIKWRQMIWLLLHHLSVTDKRDFFL